MRLLNAFSLNMIVAPATIKVEELTAESARLNLLLAAEADGESELIQSAVGHADTAAVFSAELGILVPMNRETVCLASGQTAIVGQYSGPRLPEGATKLPDGASIKWLAVTVS
jgi:hypothetical protein